MPPLPNRLDPMTPEHPAEYPSAQECGTDTRATAQPLALVTGAGKRLGFAIALELARAGYDLIAHAHQSHEGLQQLERAVQTLGRQLYPVSADLSQPHAVAALAEQVVAQHGRLDALVHNAGLIEQTPVEQLTRAQWQRLHAVNLEAPFFLTQGLLPALRAAPKPCIIHLCDIYGERPMPHHLAYEVSKAGLSMLTRALALELAPHIRVNGVAPGVALLPEDVSPEARTRALARVPLAREGSADEIARAVCYLLSAEYVTGHILVVDGGRSSRM
ncbi:MAG: SDR family oxidoreductase [Myxococcota bacterium]